LAFIQRCGVQAVRRDTLFAILFWIAAWHLLALTLSGVALCYAAFAFSWSSQQYVYHVRTPRHLIEGAYDLKLWTPLRWLYLNFNYHLSHHRAVAVPWLYMPEVAREQPRLGYLDRYLSLWQPPQPVDQAWPVEHQARGPLLPPSIPTTAG
ncbi:MAG: fatty acid desaturase, partial [Gammaproteobacteria bacterium]|nr:fatty acid desaturase [Gammaproteobacteria bacterium]